MEVRREGREGNGVLWPIRGFVGAVVGLLGCEADAVVALDLGCVVINGFPLGFEDGAEVPL